MDAGATAATDSTTVTTNKSDQEYTNGEYFDNRYDYEYQFCPACRFRMDEPITCQEQLDILYSYHAAAQQSSQQQQQQQEGPLQDINNTKDTVVLVGDAMAYVLSNGFRNCSTPKVQLVQEIIVSEENNTTNDDNHHKNMARLNSSSSSSVCLLKRGLSGKWVQDYKYAARNVYPNHIPYTSTRWHYADMKRLEMGKQFMPYNTYKWVDDTCPMSEITKSGFCQVMFHLNMDQVLIIGDSLSMQFRKALEAMLGFPFTFVSNETMVDWLAKKEVVIPCDDHDITSRDGTTHVDFQIRIQLLVLMPYRDAIAMHPRRNETWVREVWKNSAARLQNNKKLEKSLYQKDRNIWEKKKFIENNERGTAIVMNLGAWMNSFSEYRPSIEALLAWVDTLPKEKIVPFFRDTVPGFPSCEPRGEIETFDWTQYPKLRPYSNYAEYQRHLEWKKQQPEAKSWKVYDEVHSNGTFEMYNQYTKDMIASRPNDSVKIHWLNVYNATILRHDGLMGFSDCLHQHLPGPSDTWVQFFYSALLDLAGMRAIPIYKK